MSKYQQGFPVNENGEIVVSGTNQSVVGVLPIDMLPVDDDGGLKLSHLTMIVNTIADLKALSAGQFSSVQVLGYYAAGDGGGGVFRWNGSSTAADNGGTVIIPNSAPGDGRWDRIYQTLDVNMFGAKGDGTGDDTGAINAALAASKKIYLRPGGVYVISSGLTIPLDGAVIVGYGATLKWKENRTFASRFETIQATGKTVTILGLTIDGNKQNQANIPNTKRLC